MCGIAGIIGARKSDIDLDAVIKEMTNSMTHRGPDGMGYDILSFDNDPRRNYVALGHRRLKIIDLSERGRQPMFNASGSIGIVFNGEIYNYVELKKELESSGVSFSSTSDTEVALKAYEAWRGGCFGKFNGMWAMAIFDKTKRRTILARDRFGVKPLYYYKNKTEFVFASEIKALLKHPSVERKPNMDRVFRYIALSYRYGDIDESSFFENIHQVPKSSYIEVDERLGTSLERYWELSPTDVNRGISDGEAIEKFREIFIDAVRIRLRSDVPVGCMLSGGTDSTSIACVAYKILKNPIITFSGITGAEKGVYDESEYIDSVVKAINANAHYIRPAPSDMFTTVDEMLSFHDEPICAVTWYGLYLIAKKIREQNMHVVLNGHAGDELLGGYWVDYHYNFYDLFESGDIDGMSYEVEMWKKNHGRDAGEIDRMAKYISSMKADRALEISIFSDYSHLFNEEIATEHKRDFNFSSPFPGELPRRLHIELMKDGVPTVLRPEDRNTMSQSIESRSPFLDYRLAEFCFSLPNKFRIRNGIGKWLLRESMKGILPEDVRTRKDKAGFIAPADEWFRTINKNQVLDLMDSRSFQDRKLFNKERLSQMFEEHLRKEQNHQMVLWQIVNLELWYRRFIDA